MEHTCQPLGLQLSTNVLTTVVITPCFVSQQLFNKRKIKDKQTNEPTANVDELRKLFE